MSRYIIEGTLTTLSPLHIGAGWEEQTGDGSKDDPKKLVAQLALDSNNKPCIPGSTLKGILRARVFESNEIGASARNSIFGSVAGDKTTPGKVQFLTATSKKDVTTFEHVRHARERKTKAVENEKLFTREMVHDGAQFAVTLIANGLDDDEIAALTGLLHGASDKQPLEFGAGTASGKGRAIWGKETKVSRVASAAKFWSKFKSGATLAATASATTIQPTSLSPVHRPMALNVSIKIDGPFLSFGGVEQTNAGSPKAFIPRRLRNGKVVFDGHSFHGALRAQAERICNTMGIALNGRVPVVQSESECDIVQLLFGATGWKSPLVLTDLTVEGNGKKHTQEFVAIDRFTGGSAEGLKFKGESVVNPTLFGTLSIHTHRITDSVRRNQALGLLALVLHDLDEGDIPLGYGASAKGYGQVGCETNLYADFQKILESREKEPSGEDVASVTALFRATAMPSENVTEVEIKSSESLKDFVPDSSNANTQETFHNPYQFLPTNAPTDKSKWSSKAHFDGREANHHWHDRYANATSETSPQKVFSGRIVCKLTTVTPTVVGGQQEAGVPAVVKPFMLDGNVALPATSLRGMIGALIEAASQSALRVLENQQLSIRQPMENALSAMGRVVAIGDNFYVLPLCLPTLEATKSEDGTFTAQILENWVNVFQLSESTSAIPFKLLFDDLTSVLKNRDQATPPVIKNAEKRLGVMHAYAAKDPDSLKPKLTAYYAELNGALEASLDASESRIKGLTLDRFHIKEVVRKGNTTYYLLGYGYKSSVYAQKDDVPDGAPGYRGILRRFYAEQPGRYKNLPKTKTHETWLPYFASTAKKLDRIRTEKIIDETILNSMGLFKITDLALNTFNLLADERTASQRNELAQLHDNEKLPFVPTDTMRQRSLPETVFGGLREEDRDHAARLKDMDIVYFDVEQDKTTKAISVNKVAYSSIWRELIVNAQHQPKRIDQFFDPELVPMNEKRTRISPAEWMLGFTTDNARTLENEKLGKVAAFAGKLRFSFGHPTNAPRLGDPVTLKILGNPKLPSPKMYFNPKVAGDFDKKKELRSNLANAQPKGRKVYLGALRDNLGATHVAQAINLNRNGSKSEAAQPVHGLEATRPPWQHHPADPNDENAIADEARANKQRVSVTPIPENTDFYFHVDFDNLSRKELELLCFSLAPQHDYEHRLGMGKPLGLGSVKITPQILAFVDRAKRYASDTPTSPRYHEAWCEGDLSALPKKYQVKSDTKSTRPFGEWANAGAAEVKRLDESLYRSIMLTGLPSAVTKPVHTPQLAGQNIEGKNYEWFVNNDEAKLDPKPQYLEAINQNSTHLPTLSRVKRQRARP
jgi:CRISPR/Cas system CSM-associated protein Csm3 (group 7 of RAMP superfamily)